MSKWDTSLFSCFQDFNVCLISCFCFPCQLAYQKAAVNNQPCEVQACVSFLICPCCLGALIRSDIREKYGFTGSFCVDFLVLCSCTICAISQQTRQLDIRGLKPAGMFMDHDPYETIGPEKTITYHDPS